ncbi:hypothetical protein L1049_004051 [Liquidambar formosana]|uniref:Uncharacterized protein n=1 Tax=Liquidambar formosana TaxID=63359 RepID=A0AAP0RMR0_LIQFO
MGAISPLCLSCLLPPHHHFPSSKTHLSNPHISSPLSLKPTTTFLRTKNTFLVFGSNSNDPIESMFLDENGSVDDMDGYLNYLSLEYDSVWDTKPSWHIQI